MKTHNLKKGLIPLSIFLMLSLFIINANALYIGITSDTLAPSYWSGGGFSEIEWQYDIQITGTASDFYMAFQDNYQGTDDLDTFTLYINGINCGNPYQWLAVMPNSTQANLGAMHWSNLNTVTFNNEIVLFEVVHASGYKYGYFPINVSDLDGDGDHVYKYNALSEFADGTYNGNNNGYDVLYILEYSSTLPELINDTLIVTPNDIQQNMGVGIFYTIDSLGFQNYITVTHNSIEISNYSINTKTGWFTYYNTSNVGEHNVSLVRQGVTEAYDLFDVTAFDRDWYIKFYPNPVSAGTIVRCEVFFNFSAYNGTLVNSITGQEYFCPSGSVATNFTFNSGLSGAKEFILYGVTNGVKVDYIGSEILYVGHLTLTTQLDISQKIIYIGHYVPIVITGSHNLLGTTIQINVMFKTNTTWSLLNVIPVGDASLFSKTYYYYPYTMVGTLYFNLTLNDMLLDYDICTVLGAIVVEEAPLGIPQDYMDAMFGAFFTLGFLIIPFALSKGKAPNIIYAIFGGMGLGISTIIGFFPLWLPLMITILVVAVMIFEYKKS